MKTILWPGVAIWVLLYPSSLVQGSAGTLPVAPASVPAFGGTISLRLAEQMISRCTEHATGANFPPLSITVVDGSGAIIVLKREDGAAPATAEIALLKARTALQVRAETAALGKMLSNDEALRDTFMTMKLTSLPGGVPVSTDRGGFVGAVGVSGGMNQQDQDCAKLAESVGVNSMRQAASSVR